MSPVSESPLVSVVMPSYNCVSDELSTKYFEDSIRSILNQTVSDLELIVVDDGSTDATADFVRKIEDPRNRIVVNPRNMGRSVARHRGVEAAKGKFIAMMDADDFSLPHRIEEQLRYLEKNESRGLCGTWVEVKEENAATKVWRFPGDPRRLKALLLFSPPVAGAALMMRTELRDHFGLNYRTDIKRAEDYDFLSRASEVTQLGNVQKVLYSYNFRGEKRDQENEGGRRVRDLELKKLGLSPSERELQIHYNITYFIDMKEDPFGVGEYRDWFRTLEAANDRTGVYDRGILKAILAHKWITLMKKKRTTISFSSWIPMVLEKRVAVWAFYKIKRLAGKLAGR